MSTSASTSTVEIEQPVITAETKFRRGGFKPAAEVIAEAGGTPEAPAPEQADDPEMQAAILADPNVTFENPEGVTLGTQTAEVPEEETEEVTSEAGAPAANFKIGGREFGSQEEAWAYAEQLEQERLTADAFRQGVELASQAAKGNLAPQPPQPEVTREIDPLYYTDPQAYFAKMQAEIVAKADATIEAKRRQKETHDQTWNQFYSDYPDLASAREFVDLTLQQNWNTLQYVETKQALKQLAEKTRAKLKPIIDARMPKTELPKVKTAASPGGQQQVTQTKTPAKPLNFAQQMKSLKKNRAQFR